MVAAHEGCETDAVANLFDIGDRKQYSSLLNGIVWSQACPVSRCSL